MTYSLEETCKAFEMTSLPIEAQQHFAYLINQFEDGKRSELLALISENPSLAQTLYENLVAKGEILARGNKGDEWEQLSNSEEQHLQSLD